FTALGVYVSQFGTTGTGDGQFLSPRAIAVDGSGFIFVTEDALASKRVQKFTSAGVFVTKWGSTGSGDGQFAGPRGITVDGSGNVYVADTLNDRVQKFTNSGVFVSKWGTNGSGNGQLIFPIGVGVRSGSVYVVDQNNHRVQQFTTNGGYVSQIGTRCQLGSGTGCVDPDGGGPNAIGDGQFNSPTGIATDRFGFLYVVDTGNSRIEKFGDAEVVGTPDDPGLRTRLHVSPNPFRARTQIAFNVDEAATGASISVRILDVTGREMRRLWEGRLPAGNHVVAWNGATDAGYQVPKGLYFVVVQGAGLPRTLKLVRLQ
ncbi:MAG TPA: FlgD immunoglobulin-like domain containing protein, partial [Candidatus Eisenbacteria bacterium]|nr:FlgD immunoglobulin-like domain containing protein [Candidatus Eisenbacteria bacterium]